MVCPHAQGLVISLIQGSYDCNPQKNSEQKWSKVAASGEQVGEEGAEGSNVIFYYDYMPI